MKNHYKTMIASLVIALQLFTLNAQTFEWAKQIGSTGSDVGLSITIDATGNVFTTGYFSGTVDFDPGAGTAILTSDDWDSYVTKFDASGNFVWVNHIGGQQSEVGNSIAVDQDGNSYVTGYFFGTAEFYSNTETITMTGVTIAADMFIAKYDASGNFVWARQIGGEFAERGLGIAVDDDGNVYTTGYFEATTDFDPGVGTFILETTSFASTDAFVSKLDTDGNFVWAKQLGGQSAEHGNSIYVDGSGNVYTTGYFFGTADFDPGAGVFELTSTGNRDVFISKLNASGDFVWAKNFGGSAADEGNSIYVDDSENVYITGYFSGTADFDTGSDTFELTATGTRDIFVTKLNNSGNLLWAKRMGGAGSNSIDNDNGNGITVDLAGNVYFTGSYRGTADFDPGDETFNLVAPNGVNNPYVSKLDASGNFIWAKRLAGNVGGSGNSITLDDSNNILLIGNFSGTVDFDPSESETFSMTSSGNSDIYIVKLTQEGPVSVAESIENINFIVYPNPSNGLFALDFKSEMKNAFAEVYDLSGRIIHTQSVSSTQSEINLTNNPTGIYFLKLIDYKHVIATEKLIIR